VAQPDAVRRCLVDGGRIGRGVPDRGVLERMVLERTVLGRGQVGRRSFNGQPLETGSPPG